MATGEVHAVWRGHAQLGEGPVWCAALRRVLFVDIRGARLMAWAPDEGSTLEWPLDEAICWLVERADGDGFIAGLKRRIVHLRVDLARGPEIVATLAAPEPDLPGNRFNDGKADPFGNVWFGSMDAGEKGVSGALWRMNPAGEVAKIDGGYGIANGPAISPDGGTFYHTDSPARVIYAFDLAPDRALSNKRPHIRLSPDEGFPDGMTCDVEGGLWVAHYGGGRITRHLPDGTLARTIPMPTARISSLCFFGERLDRLVVTSASGDEPDEMAGALFVVEPDVVGAPVGRWGAV